MRSLLFVPGDSDRKLAKAHAADADVLILDLEDSVATDRKAQAREMTREFIGTAKAAMAEGARWPRLYVRINSLQSDFWTADLDGVMPAGPAGGMLPQPPSRGDADPPSRHPKPTQEK